MTSTQPNPTQTTDAGIPVESDEYSLTVGPDGPILLQDSYLIEAAALGVRLPLSDPFPVELSHLLGLYLVSPARRLIVVARMMAPKR